MLQKEEPENKAGPINRTPDNTKIFGTMKCIAKLNIRLGQLLGASGSPKLGSPLGIRDKRSLGIWAP